MAIKNEYDFDNNPFGAPLKTLQELVAGDTVAVITTYKKELATIDKVTDTQIVIGNQRYKRVNGYLILSGANYNSQHIKVPTHDMKVYIARANRKEFLRTYNWNGLDMTKDYLLIQSIFELLNERNNEPKTA